jgi:iron complex outermembrane receptor protein
LALTLLDATYRDGFLACAGVPCTAPTVPVPAGNRIAGTQRGNAFAELVWQPAGATELALEARAASATAANDTNTQFAPGYALINLRASQRYPLGDGMALELLARLDNVTDRVYSGSVIVNDANGRYFETGAPRSALLSLRLSRAF